MIVDGVMRQRSVETRDGEKRTVVELDVDEIGASLRYATVRVDRATAAGDRRELGPRQPGTRETVPASGPVPSRPPRSTTTSDSRRGLVL